MPGEVDLSVGLLGSSAKQAGLTVVAQQTGRHQRAFHVVIHGELNPGISSNFAEGCKRSNLALRQANRAFAVDANRVHLPRGRSDQNHRV